ncbi:hypothetical protein AB0K71_33435 [Streptomyces syringium]|uniref:hypothetical protein n=1 Tax=Streptomyces syringium TaxID=76729 RepID=UPI0033A7F36B
MSVWGRAVLRSALRALVVALISVLLTLSGSAAEGLAASVGREETSGSLSAAASEEYAACASEQRGSRSGRRSGRPPGRLGGALPPTVPPGVDAGRSPDERAVLRTDAVALAAARARHAVLRC